MEEHSHIEDFFRKRLDSHEFAFQEEDWLKMEEKLELAGFSSHATRAHSPVKLIIIILAGLITAFFLGWMTNELIRKNRTSEILNTNRSIDQTTITNNAQGNNSENTESAIMPDRGKNNSKDSLKRSNGKAAEINRAESIGEPRYTEPKSEVDEVSYDEPLNFQALAQPTVRETPVVKLPESPDLVTDERWMNDLKLLQGLEKNLHTQYNIDIALPDATIPGSGVASRNFLNRFSIGLAIAPDLNSTSFLHQKSMSPAVGGVINYALSPRWSLSVRLFYNNKKYRSSGEYYNVPYDYWQNRTNGVVPDVIDGSCRVIDVPVLLSYSFIQKRVVSFTASAGLGSYFLLDEKYKFTFNGTNPGAATEWKTSENSQVYFKVVNLAMGLSLRTGRRTSMLLEPYVKIPLQSMGWAKVNLSGMGLSVSMNYHF